MSSRRCAHVLAAPPHCPSRSRRGSSGSRARLVEGYGLSEAGPVTHANPLGGQDRPGFIGLPLPSTDAKVVDLATGADLPPGQIDELLVKGPQVMQGYWNRPQETAETLLADGWLRTGDIARMDTDGFFQVIERRKEMIVAGRYNIYPRDIEEVLYEHPKIVEAAVAGVPREGQTDVKALVVLRRGESATAEEIIQFLRERLSAYKLPSAIEFREALPARSSARCSGACWWRKPVARRARNAPNRRKRRPSREGRLSAFGLKAYQRELEDRRCCWKQSEQ
jgi:acyl-CoA synthetase (AMP-forming)/AMP-acid ligase II